jgi:hypothetical protein
MQVYNHAVITNKCVLGIDSANNKFNLKRGNEKHKT